MPVVQGLAGLDALPDAPVLISGGGPSGLFLALDLAHRGVRSIVLEPRTSVDPDRPRAKTTNARTMTHLRRLGLADALREAAPLSAEYAEDVIFCSSLVGYEVARFPHAFQVARGRYELQPECGQQVAQPIVESVLRAAVGRSELATLVTGVRVETVELGGAAEFGGASGSGDDTAKVVTVAEVDTGDASADARQAAGDGTRTGTRTRTRSARYVIGADGATSAVRRSLGIGLEGGSAGRSNLNVLFRSRQLADVVQLGDAIQYWVMAPGASGIIGRADLDCTWWAIVQGVDVTDPALDPVALVRRMAGHPVDVEVVATDPWTARMLLAPSYGRDGVYLIGDAAHLNPPWGGHGFNTCIGDAANLAWKLAACLEGWGGDALLESYELERRPVAARTIRDAAANGGNLAYDFADDLLGAETPAGEARRAEARVALAVKQSEFDSLGLVLGYRYGDSPLVTPDAPHARDGAVVSAPGTGSARVADASEPPAEHPIEYVPTTHPGSLLPHAWLPDGRSLYDLLDDRGFTLLVAGDNAADEAQWQALTETRVPVRLVLLGPDDRAAIGAWSTRAVLVRPDQHVAWRGSDPGEAAEALARAAALTPARKAEHV